MIGVTGVQARELSAEDIGQIQGLLAEHPDWGRTRLTEEFCRRWDWRNAQGRPVACALFGSAAWKCADRDAYVGWDRVTRERNLERLTNNTRFLILPWVVVPHLASHVLSPIARRIDVD